MSNTVDSRVVEMRFDNRQFESNVSTSLSTLDKLKSALRLDGVTKGLDNINTAAKNLNFNPIGSGLEAVKVKFSALEVMAVTALSNITNSAVNAGKRLVSAFTIDPIKTGLQEYETQINAVQTILANTESKGSTLQDVNRALNELNVYADKTIYNFTEMTRNIGTFTAAGLDLKTSTSAIQGIANVAAVSGSNAEQASRAMYQLSQALSSGTVKLMDWNSVVNAGMGGQVLQDALKATSRECVNVANNVRAMSEAELEAYKISHGYTDDQIKSIKEYAYNVDELIETSGSFRESLTHGWITADVLSRTLSKFTKTGAVEYISEMTGASITSVQELQKLGDTVGWDSKQVNELALSIANGNKEMAENVISTGRMASTAEDAATKVKTFTQLMDTLKEAAQSGWTQTWQIIIGDFGEAKELFTAVSDTLGKIIGDSANARNALLSGGLSTGWKQLLNSGITDAEGFEKIVTDVAKSHGVNLENMIDAEHDFQDTLKEGWLNVDILKESIAQYGKGLEGLSIEELKAKGYTLEDAQAYIRLKEAIDDGSISLEDFQDKISRASGRENIIEGLKRSFESLMAILKPVGDAFKMVFPPATAEQLYSLTEVFLKFTKSLTPTSRQLVLIGQTFRGVFSVIDIGLTVLKQLGSAIFSILGNFTGLGTGVLEVTASMGDWLYGLRNSIKETDIFGGAVEKINNFLDMVRDKFESMRPAIEEFKKRFSDISSKIVPNVSSAFEKLGSAIGWIGGFLKNVIAKIKEFGTSVDLSMFDGLVVVLKKVWGFVTEACAGIVDAFVGMLRNGDIKAGLDTFNSGVITAILVGIKKMLNIGDTLDSLSGGFLGGITKTLDSVRGSLETWQQSLKADTLTKLATAIALLAGSLIALAMVDPEKLTGAIASITTLFGELVGSMAILNHIGTFDKSFGTASNTMIKMAAAVLILSAALAKIGNLDWEQMVRGLTGVTLLLGEVIGASILLSKYGGKVKSCGMQMILIAAAMEIFADVCSKFEAMSWEGILKGVSGIGLILLEFVGFQKLLSMIKPKKMLSSATSLVIIGAAMEIFADVCSKFGAMEWGDLGKTGVAMAGILALAAGFGLLAGLSKGMIGSSIALVIIAAGLEIMADVSSKLGSMSWESLAKAGVGIAGILALAAGFGLLAGLAPGMVASSAALLIMSVAMELMADVCSKLGSMDWEALGKAGVAITGILVLAAGFGLLAGLAPGMVAASAALLIMAAALSVLAPVMIMLGTMSWEGIAISLVAMAGAFAVLGIAGALLQPLIPSILGLSAAVALLGVGCLACGAGVALLAAGLAALAAGGAAGAAALVAVIMEIVNLLPIFVQKVGESFVALLQVIGESAPLLINVVVQIGLALLQALTMLLPPLLEFVLFAITEVLRVIAENIQPIIERVVEIVVGIIEALNNKVGDILQVITDLIISILTAIADSAGQLIQAGVDLIVNLIDGLAIGIEENTPRIKEALTHLGQAMLDAFCEFFGIHSPSTVFADVGGYLIQGLINGVGNFVSQAVGKIKQLASDMLDAIKSKVSEFKAKGSELINNLKTGISSKTSAVITTLKSFAGKVVGAIKDKVKEFKTIGSNMIDGLKNGINAAKDKAVEAAKGVASSIKKKVEKFFDINSPSKVFFEIGGFVVEGLANGIDKNAVKTNKAAAEMAKGLMTSFSGTIKSIDDTADSMNYGAGVMKAYLKEYGQFTSSVEDNNKVIKNASDSVMAYAKSVYMESDQYKEDTKQLEEHKKQLSELYAKRKELEKQTKSSMADAKKTLTTTEAINKETEKTSTTIDKAAKSTSKSVDIASDRVSAFCKNLGINLDDLKAKATEYFTKQGISLDELVNKYGSFENALISGDSSINGFINQLNPLNDSLTVNSTTVSSLNNDLQSLDSQIEQTKKQIIEDEKAIQQHTADTFNNIRDTIKKNVESSIDILKVELDTGVDLFNKFDNSVNSIDPLSKFNDGSDGNSEPIDILGNMKSQIDGISAWESDIEELARRGLGEPLLNYLRDLGPQGAAQVKEFMRLSGQELEQANEYYSQILTIDTSNEDVLGNMKSQLDGVKEWRANLEQLKESGLCEGLLKDLEAMGPEGAAKVRSFLQLSAEELAQANSYYEESLSLSADQFLDSYAAKLNEQADWAEGLKALAEKGFDQGIIEALGEAGQESGQAYLDAFMNMDPSDIAEVNAKFKEALTLPDATADSIMATYIRAGEISTTAYAESIDANSEKTDSAAKAMSEKAAKAIIEKTASKWAAAGTNVVVGFVKGINTKSGYVQSAVIKVAKNALAAMKKSLSIHSPSREFMKLGGFVSEGFANGITNSEGQVIDSISTISNDVLANASNIITGINDIMNDKAISSPTISPVINMDDINTERLKMTSSLDTVMTAPIKSVSTLMADAQLGIEKSNEKLANGILNLREDINRLYSDDNSKEIALYVDSKKLATSMAKPMNRQLNILYQRERGV